MIGEVLDGKYRIDKQLGAGGMGAVYLATHLGTTRVVAVKVIAPKWAREPQFLARFQREAQACGRLRHPNIVNVTDFGVAASRSGDMPYLVMEYLDGQTLSVFQKENPKPNLPLIADVLDQIALALGEAHRHGIVHRDLKPDNIWLEPNGRGGYTVKVLDFGVAKLNLLAELAPAVPSPEVERPSPVIANELETVAMESTPAPPVAAETLAEDLETVAIVSTPTPAGSRLSAAFASGSWDSGGSAQTVPGSLLGTPAYMSPEQAFGSEVDFRSDIYSLAVVAYSLVCGQLPFTGKGGDLLDFLERGSPIPPAQIAKIPRDVSDAILAGLARRPADRPQSAIAFARRFHNSVDAEFLALRRSKAFLLQHLGPFSLLIFPLYTALLTIIGLLVGLGPKFVTVAAIRMTFIPLIAAWLLILSDNVLRASAALMALDERTRVRRFVSFRVMWRLIKLSPKIIGTQIQSIFFFGPGWVIRDALWPVVCAVEGLRGKAALLRSRELMTGLTSAGRALAIRHFALAVLAIADALKSMGGLIQTAAHKDANLTVTAVWFPVFALYAAAPLFLYDRTAASESGPLLQLDRTPEVRVTARALSTSSIVWVIVGIVYVLYEIIERAFLRGK